MKRLLLPLLLLTIPSSCVYQGSISSSETSDSLIEDSISSSETSSEEKEKDIEKLNYLKSVFGEDIQIYSNNENNPYNIDINKYGNNVDVVFYEDKISSTTDPYVNVNKSEFYENYSKASSYEDSFYRTKHGLMSGEITPVYYLANQKNIIEDDKYVRYSNSTYVLSTTGEYIAYLENTLDDTYNLIYYNGGYTSLNEVGAYLLAFGNVPANNNFDKGSSGKTNSVNTWGEYGRVNNTRFSGDTSRYPYEPLIPTVKEKEFHETDFGTTGGFSLVNEDLNVYDTIQAYNNGKSITRGTARMIFTYDPSVTKIDDRYVFYTYNHYNDFQEYLNYTDGWGKRFGNESAGNGYCGSSNDYYATNKNPITQYPETIIKSI